MAVDEQVVEIEEAALHLRFLVSDQNIVEITDEIRKMRCVALDDFLEGAVGVDRLAQRRKDGHGLWEPARATRFLGHHIVALTQEGARIFMIDHVAWLRKTQGGRELWHPRARTAA